METKSEDLEANNLIAIDFRATPSLPLPQLKGPERQLAVLPGTPQLA